MRRITVTLSLLQGVRDTGRSLNYSEQRAAPPLHATTAHHVGQPSPVNSGPTHHGTAIPKAHCSSVSPHPAESLSAITDICCPSCIYPDTYQLFQDGQSTDCHKRQRLCKCKKALLSTTGCVPPTTPPTGRQEAEERKKKKKGGLNRLDYTQNSEF